MPTYQISEIKYTPKFGKLFKKLNPLLQKTVYDKTKIFRQNCFSPGLATHKIKKDIWSFSITGNLRILLVFEDHRVVTFIDIGPHSHVYKRK